MLDMKFAPSCQATVDNGFGGRTAGQSPDLYSRIARPKRHHRFRYGLKQSPIHATCVLKRRKNRVLSLRQ